MNNIHSLSTEPHKNNSDVRVTIARNFSRFISCYFMQLLNKFNFKKHHTMLKNLQTVHRAIQNGTNLLLPKQRFVKISLNIFIKLLKVNNDFKYFIFVGRVLKHDVEGGASHT